MIGVQIPEALIKFANNQNQLELGIRSLPEFSAELLKTAPRLHSVIFSPNGKLCGFVNLYLDGALVSHRMDQDIALTAANQLTLVAAVSGG